MVNLRRLTPMQLEQLETKRLLLTKVNQEVMDYVFSSLSGAEQMVFLGCETAGELAEHQRRYDGGLSTYNRKFLYFFLIHKETKKNIGWCGYHTWYTEHSRAELGYTLHPDFHQRGLMTEALTTILAYGFRTMNLHRVEALVGPRNVPSQRLMQIFHFEMEGYLREHYKVNGVNDDSEIFGLLKKDYLSNPKIPK